ncbi:hypothetical protein GOV05_01655 [Candidatus Woesearchaeota archaeon]|nr:hypothetical protein [Candidatus Woesearchaeota archaeon]
MVEKKNLVNDTREVFDTLSSVERRSNLIDENLKKIDKTIRDRDFDWADNIRGFEIQIDELTNQVGIMNDKLSKTVIKMEDVISKFKNTTKIREHDSVQKRVHEWKVEGLVTKMRFKLLLAQELEKRMN